MRDSASDRVASTHTHLHAHTCPVCVHACSLRFVLCANINNAKNRKCFFSHDSKITTHAAVTKTNHCTMHTMCTFHRPNRRCSSFACCLQAANIASLVAYGSLRVSCSDFAYCFTAANIAVLVLVSVPASQHCSQTPQDRDSNGHLCPRASRSSREIQGLGAT